MRQTSPATSLRRKSPWRRRSRAASGGRHRGLRAPRSASMAWALRAKRLRRASNTVRFHAARWHDSADFSRSIGRFPPDFLPTLESQRRPRGMPFALGSKGLASAASAANARKKSLTSVSLGDCTVKVTLFSVRHGKHTRRQKNRPFFVTSPGLPGFKRTGQNSQKSEKLILHYCPSGLTPGPPAAN